VLALVALPALGESQPSAAEIVGQSQRAFYYPGSDMQASVTMDLVSADGKKRARRLTMLRKNEPGSHNQRYFLYFHEPGDVRRTAFLVWKYPERDDDRWIFIPAVNMVRRVAASDSRSSFVGSDFTYEDISGRDLSGDTHTLVREEQRDGAACYVIESLPKTPADYTKKLAWIDKTTLLPRKEEYYDTQNELARIFTADTIEDVVVVAAEEKTTIPTITRRTMKNVKSGHWTEVRLSRVGYDVGLEDEIFAERALQNPPRKWIE
jgi:hypothetical protein